jgi:hypothetical protein
MPQRKSIVQRLHRRKFPENRALRFKIHNYYMLWLKNHRKGRREARQNVTSARTPSIRVVKV